MSWPNREELLQSFTYEKLKEFRFSRIIGALMDLALILFVLFYIFFGKDILIANYERYKVFWNFTQWILIIGIIAESRRTVKNIKYLNDILLEMKRRKNSEATK